MLEGIGGGIILAIVNFMMVFLVLGGLSGVLVVLKRLIMFWETRQQALKAIQQAQLDSGSAAAGKAPQDLQNEKHLAAITAAVHEFTGQPAGSLRVDSIEPLVEAPVSQNQTMAVISAALHHYLETPEGSLDIQSVTPIQASSALYAAITAALHEYLATPEGSFRIVRIQPVGAINTWKMAGRLDAMGFERN